MRALIMALAAALLVACGGGGSPAQDSGPVPAPPAASAPAPIPPAASTPAPAPPAASAPVVKTKVWEETWDELFIQGWTRVEPPPCKAGSFDDPGAGPRTQFKVGDWTTIGQVPPLPTKGSQLVVDTEQFAVGFALLSGPLFDHTSHVRAETTVQLTPDPGAWVGLTLHNGEGNYREIGIGALGGINHAVVHAPCYLIWLDPVPPGPAFLAIEHSPALGWRMVVNDKVVYQEPPGFRNNTLTAPANVGLFFVNLEAEARQGPRLLRVTVDPVRVFEIK